MVGKGVFVNYYNLYPIWLQNASIHVKKVLVLKSKMVIVKVPFLGIFIRSRGCSRSRSIEPDPEPQFGLAAQRSRSRLRNTAYYLADI